jgi:hypothetical protein
VKTQFSVVNGECGVKRKGEVNRSEVGGWKGLDAKRSEDDDDDREIDKCENTFFFFLGFVFFF